MDRCQWTMDNYWKLGFHQKIKKGRKMRKENENKIIDNQHNISYSSGILFHCHQVPAGFHDFINIMKFIDFQLN